MKNLLLKISAVATLLVGALSCEKLETYDNIPEVRFKHVYIADTTDKLKNQVKHQMLYFDVIDGDGNLGLNKEDTLGKFNIDSLYYYNFFIEASAMDSTGVYYTLDSLNKNLKYRIPYNEPIGQNKYLKAEIKVKFEIPLSFVTFDTIMYSFYVYDRELNKSNIAQTCAIPLNVHGTVYADGSVKKVKEKDE